MGLQMATWAYTDLGWSRHEWRGRAHHADRQGPEHFLGSTAARGRRRPRRNRHRGRRAAVAWRAAREAMRTCRVKQLRVREVRSNTAHGLSEGAAGAGLPVSPVWSVGAEAGCRVVE